MDGKAIITIITVSIGFITFLEQGERKYHLLKFSRFDKFIILMLFIFINYLTFFDYPTNWGMYSEFFINPNGLKPQDWAYVVSLVLLIFIWLKIHYSFFPSSRKNELFLFYKDLLNQKKFDTLLSLIDKFHKDDILRYYATLTPDPNLALSDFERKIIADDEKWTTKAKKKLVKAKKNLVQLLFPKSQENRNNFANNLMHEIIGRDVFINKTATMNPYFFSGIFEQLNEENDRYFPSEFINRVLSILLLEKDFWLFNELKETSNLSSKSISRKAYIIDEKHEILSFIFKDFKVTKYFELWKPFGDISIQELVKEGSKKNMSLFIQEYVDEEFLSKTVTFNSIHFIDILIREVIERKETHHFWLHYYHTFTSIIVKNIVDIENFLLDENETQYSKLLDSIFNNLLYWLRIIKSTEHTQLLSAISTCLGNCLFAICNCEKVDEEYCIKKVNSIIDFHGNLIANKTTYLIWNEIESKLLNPSGTKIYSEKYLHILHRTFKELDRYKFQSAGGIDYLPLKRLRKKIIENLDIDVSY